MTKPGAFLLGLLLGWDAQATDSVVFSETDREIEAVAHPVYTLASEIGATSNYGNTVSSIVYLNFDGAARWGGHKLSSDGLVELGRAVTDADGDGTISLEERREGYQSTAREIGADVRYDRYVADRNAVYLLAGWLHDPFSGYQRRLHLQGGISRLVMDDETQNLLVEVGADVARENYTSGVSPNRAWIYSARTNIEWLRSVSEQLQGGQSLEVFLNVQDPRDIRILSETAFTLSVTDALGVKATVLWAHDTVPVEGYRTTDASIALTLVAGIERSGGPVSGPAAPWLGEDPS